MSTGSPIIVGLNDEHGQLGEDLVASLASRELLARRVARPRTPPRSQPAAQRGPSVQPQRSALRTPPPARAR
eukprot:684686-Lingulodinium_polyedra.AAC.1